MNLLGDRSHLNFSCSRDLNYWW